MIRGIVRIPIAPDNETFRASIHTRLEAVVARVEPRHVPQVQPPIDVKKPPEDAAKTTSGLSYKRLVEKIHGLQPGAGESVLIRYTGWRQNTAETFFTTGTEGQTMTINPTYGNPSTISVRLRPGAA